MNKIPIVIDCDPGVDDAYAIALANSCEMFDIKAITPVNGNVVFAKTTVNGLGLAEMLDIDCIVAKGAEKALFRTFTRNESTTHGNSGVGTVIFPPAKRTFDERPAWDVIYDEAVKAEGKLILFAIGPLTNIAIALEKYPDLPKLIKKFVIMGGGTFGNATKYAEFNIWVDPTAAKICFEQFETYMVGLNATHAAALTTDDFDEMMVACGDRDNAYLVRELSKFSKKNAFENGSDSNVIHDALAIASIMDERVCTYEPFYTYVEDDDNAANMGETVVDLEGKSGKAPNSFVAMKVDKDLFKEQLVEMCKFYNK